MRINRQKIQRPNPAKPTRKVVRLDAAYDVADMADTALTELFGRAGFESGLSALDPQTRRTLIDRSRYEILQANAWLKGSARSAVNWVIGRGPFLEVKLDGKPEIARAIEQKFNAWMKLVKAPRKLRTMCYAKITDGSGMALVITNERLKGKVKLDFVPFEDDQVRAPFGQLSNGNWQAAYALDGKELDVAGNPLRYWILDQHPADNPGAQPKPIDAEYVIDVWCQERPSQGRAVPEMATAIGNGPMMRIYQKAVLDAATTAAKHTVLIETNVDKFDDGEIVYQPVDAAVEMPITYGTQTFLPEGHKASQLKAEQPTATHSEFMRHNVSAAGRPIGQPSHIATGDAIGSNYASGQLGRQDYETDVDVQRQDWETEGLDKLLTHWLQEAALVGEIPAEYADGLPAHEWRWNRKRHQDTMKEYTGRQVAVGSGLTSPSFWQEDDGVDPEEEDAASARSHGITIEQFREARFRTLFPVAAIAVLGAGLTPAPAPPTTGGPPDKKAKATR